MTEWRDCKFGEIATFSYGKMPNKKNIVDCGYPIFSGYKIVGYYNSYMYEDPQLIIVARGVGGTGDVKISPPKSYITNLSIIAELHPDKANKKFLYYYFKINNLRELDSGSAQSQITINDLNNYCITLPPLPEQKAIAEVLSSLDDKIDLLTRQNKTLEDLAQVYFRKWFGEGEQIARMGDFFPVKTGKKDANIATDDGKYLFFTCSKEPLRTDSYSFDESSILLAGNGDFNVKWYRGKFEAYQRTYVLTPYDPDDMPWLYFVISNSLNELTTGYRGSVINFITKGMIEDYKVTLPTTENFIKFKKLACEIIDKQEFNNKQISILHKLRDTLLPKLVSGEIRVKM